MRKLTLEKTCPVRIILMDKEVSRNIQILNLHISYSMFTVVDGPASSDIEAQVEQNTSYCKINMFLDSIVNNCTAVDIGDLDDLDALVQQFDNPLMIMPTLNESTLLALIHSKMNAISGDNTYIEKLKLKDLDEGVTYTYDASEMEVIEYPELPETQIEWLGEYPYWDTAWWCRNDISIYDKGAKDADEYDAWVIAKEKNNVDAENRDTLVQIEKGIREAFGGDELDKKGELVEIDFVKKQAKNVDKD